MSGQRAGNTSAEVVRGWIRSLGIDCGPTESETDGDCAALAWAASGAMAMTGFGEGPPVLSPAPAFGLLTEVARAFGAVTELIGERVEPDPAAVLSRRVEGDGRARRGQRSAGGSSRLLRAANGWCAVTLSRADDIDAVPAIVGDAGGSDPWEALEAAAARWPAAHLAERGQLLGVPAAALPAVLRRRVPWRGSRIAEPVAGRSLGDCVVVDLSSLWAGPLCARLLGRAGARIIKVESVHRPDAARATPEFFDHLHAGHEFVSVDFRSEQGRRDLGALIDAADIVIEASRPRALDQLGLGLDARPHRPGQVWLSITGYGRDHPMRVAFGDDAAVAGGLVGYHRGEPVFCADAAGDPLSGICAALAAATAVAAGGGVLLDLSMRDTAAAFATAPALPHGPHRVIPHGPDGWAVACDHLNRTQQVLPQPLSLPTAPAAGDLG
ncbi:crotonobetainyl-CoA:carnitine CoA-transferase CaiB-like acyl-CoA transferase [Nocardia transvalensis]|uniref:Crotonobetainyl-CoA:carnitine CoA-transferase CaiB-like acyl-CoA transferase n=1 Tax=Nocardia transvalensis TaxID=37333 RepID=A0A7W9PFV7_9NOCA|nr:CoA transferase [Nocardia transvalensis]MBB5915431.1 crotonobetainyl-CoA:carnitine CoA-transferase CaiB-like acyl-CoA transferase [Nocardia transvalensis]